MSGSKDLYSNVRPVATLAVAARTDGTATGTTVDRVADGEMFESAIAVIHGGAITDGSHAFELQESDDDSSWAAVAAADLQGTEPTLTSSDDNELHVLGYLGDARYIRVVAVTTGATTGGVFGATIVLGSPRVKPANA